MAAVAAAEAAAVVGEAAADLVGEAADLAEDLAAGECRGLRHPLADLHRSAVVALDPAAVA
jgi:hypothetical protein